MQHEIILLELIEIFEWHGNSIKRITVVSRRLPIDFYFIKNEFKK